MKPFKLCIRGTLIASITMGFLLSPSIANEDQIDLSFQWVEVDLSDWNALLMQKRVPLRGPELEKAIDALLAENRATLLRQMAVKTQSGQRAKGESIRETTHARKYTPATLNESGTAIIHPTPAGTEARNIGATIEIDPVLRGTSKRIAEVRLGAVIDRFLGDREWGKDEAMVKFPDFYSMKLTTGMELHRGENRFAGSFEPVAASDPSCKQPRVLLFVRAEFPAFKPLSPVKPGGIDFPLSELETAKSEALENKPINEMGVRYELLETSMMELNDLLADSQLSTAGGELREALLKAKATVVDSVAVVGQIEQRLSLYSGLELIYPTEWDEPEISQDGKLTVPGSPAAFEVVEMGTKIELEVKRREGAGQFVVANNFQSQRDRGVRRFGQEVSEVSFPLTHRAELTQKIPMGDGELVFLGTLRPDQSLVEDREQPIWVVFGQIDSLP